MKGAGLRASWDSQMVHKFCDLCIREIEMGNRPSKHLTKDGWKNILRDFVDGTGRTYDRQQLQSKWSVLKEEWKKLKVNPEAKKSRGRGIEPELEKKLDKMFTLIGDLEEYASIPIYSDDLDKPKTRKRIRKSDEEKISKIENTPQKANELSNNSDEKSPKLAQNDQPERKTPDLIANRNTERALVLREGESETRCSITEAIRLLDSLDEVAKASPLYYFAINLILDKDKREVFMALSPEMKVWWLKMEESESRK